jgi:hypothetical protein
MGLNLGVRHKNTTLPKTFTVTKTNTDRIQSGLNVGVRRRNRHYRIILLFHAYTDRTQLIPRISVGKLLRENVFRPLTVKIMDEYETQTDNSNSPSENKRTKFTNTRHINP